MTIILIIAVALDLLAIAGGLAFGAHVFRDYLTAEENRS